MGSPIRKSTGQGLFAPHRGLSQLVTSFLASESLGIPRTLLLDFLVSSNPYRFDTDSCSIVKDFFAGFTSISSITSSNYTFDSSLFSYMSLVTQYVKALF